MDDATSRQQALNNISAEDLAKIHAHQTSTKGAFAVDNEWLLLAEFAKAFGWQAYLDAKEDKITAPEMLTLIEANRKLEAIAHYRNAEAALIGAGSARAKKPSQVFKSLTKDIISKTKVQDS
jgi:hypothetical protein